MVRIANLGIIIVGEMKRIGLVGMEVDKLLIHVTCSERYISKLKQLFQRNFYGDNVGKDYSRLKHFQNNNSILAHLALFSFQFSSK